MKVTITTSTKCEPTAHAAGCKDLAKVRRRMDYSAEYTGEFATLAEVALDYWQDILSDENLEGDEAEERALSYTGKGSLDIAPCVKLPLRAKAATKPAKAAQTDKVPTSPTAADISTSYHELGSWRAVAARYGLGSPGAARRLFTRLTGKSHTEA